MGKVMKILMEVGKRKGKGACFSCKLLGGGGGN